MKKSNIHFIYTVICLVLFACNSNTENNTSVDLEIAEEDSETNKTEEELSRAVINIPSLGYWTGMFVAEEYDEDTDYSWANKITISIDKIEDGLVKGHSVVAGNFRPFSGFVDEIGDSFHFEVKEPGDDKYDGVFDFWISEDSIIEGEWNSYDLDLKVTKRVYELEPREFVYDPNNDLMDLWEFIDLGKYREVVYHYDEEEYYDTEIATVSGDAYDYNASLELLKEEDVANMKKGDLQILRNTIYARHGYSFKNRIYRTIFDNGGLEWYMPVSVDVQNELTEIEKQNIALIKRYEDYAEEYYDVFGR